MSSFYKLSTLKCDVGWLNGLIWPLFEGGHHLQACNAEFRAHVSPAHISRAGLASEWILEASKKYREGMVILWTPEAVTNAGGEYASVDWNPSDAIFSPSKTGTAMAVTAVPLPPALYYSISASEV